MSGFGTVQMLWLAGSLFALIASAVTSLAVPGLVRWTAGWAPASRHRMLVLVSLLPLVLGATALVSVMLPSLLGLRWPALDHCMEHGGHAHLCFVHPPQHTSWLGAGLLAATGVWLGTRLVRGGRGLRQASQVLGQLLRCAPYDAARRCWVLPTQAALCVSFGLLRPRLVVSAGLLETATAHEFEVMVAHEEAHARRKDSLVALVARAATLLLLPGSRRRLLASLQLAAEQTCDEHAVARSGDRLRVAETILAMERRLSMGPSWPSSPLVASFGSSSVPERVAAMLQPPREATFYAPAAVALGLVVVALLGAHEHLHHATESLLAVFTH
jgi:hypothetical protein